MHGVADRRQYFDHWHAKRSAMPKVLGSVPESVEDPVLIEIFGINPGSLRAVQNPDAANQSGLAVWRARFKNYLGLPVYLKVQIPRPPGDLSATVNREFKVVQSLTNVQIGGHQKCADRLPCSLASSSRAAGR